MTMRLRISNSTATSLALLLVGTVMLLNGSYDGGSSLFARRKLMLDTKKAKATTSTSHNTIEEKTASPAIPSAREWFHDVRCPMEDMSLLLPMHHKDFALASTLFHTLELSFPCFHELVVVVPPESEFAIAGGVPSYAKVVVVPDPLPSQFGYLSQQVIKLYADQFVTGGRVLILEADQIFKQYQEACFFSVDEQGNHNGKVRAYCLPDGGDSPDDGIWWKGTTHAIGGEMVDMNCCMVSPFAFPVQVFPAFRQHVQDIHGKTVGELMEDYFEGHSGGWTKDKKLFSEFNILDHYMLRYHPEWVELVTPAEKEKWEQRNWCAEHSYTRDYNLPNPKLTADYFDHYYHVIDETLGQSGMGEARTHTTLDVGKEWEEDWNYSAETAKKHYEAVKDKEAETRMAKTTIDEQ